MTFPGAIGSKLPAARQPPRNLTPRGRVSHKKPPVDRLKLPVL